MAGKLKGFDAKQAMIQHGEKFAFGVVVVIVLTALGMTKWTPIDLAPEDITKKVNEASQKLEELPWPEDKKQEFVLDDSNRPEQVIDNRLFSRILVTPDYYTAEAMYKDNIDRDNPLEEPEFIKVKDMVATSARVLIELRPDPVAAADEEEEEEDETDAEEEQRDLPDEFRDRNDRGNSPGSPRGEPDFRSMAAPELATRAAPAGNVSPLAGMMDGSPAGMMQTMQQQTVEGEARPFVSVRGVFEFKEQVRRFSEAMNVNYAEALQSFEIIDFELERQRLIEAPDKWTDWEAVDIDVLRDIISRANGIETDVVSAAVTDSAITCPLPMRVTGVWQKQATHERLKNFELTGEMLDREMAYNRALLSAFLEEQKQLPDSPVEKKGFSDMVFDSRQLQQGLIGLDSAYDMRAMMEMTAAPAGMAQPAGQFAGRNGATQMDAALKKFAEELMEEMNLEDIDDPKAKQRIEDWVKERATAEGELLLYRYLDFDVEPGRTYRYRVRLEIRNPNFGKPLAAAGGLPHVVQGETRFTPWSDPTTPVYVEETVKYFLAEVEPHRLRLYPEARMTIFQYDRNAGTTVRDVVDVAVGQKIGGTTKTEMPDPTKGSFEETEYVFESDDVLVDALPELKFDPKLHDGLRLPPGAGSRGETGMVEAALVTTVDQQLKLIDPVTLAEAKKREEDFLEMQNEYFAYLKENRATAGSEIGDYSAIYGDAAAMPAEMMQGMPGGRRNRNSLRRGNDPMGPGAMPGGPAGAMPGGPAAPAAPGGNRRGRR